MDSGPFGDDLVFMSPRESKRQLRVAAHVRLWQTSDRLHRRLTALLHPFGLSEPQFNVLRILRGAGPDGLPCTQVGARMVTRVPDVTRLMDRLERAGWLRRTRQTQDRRVVIAQITPAGSRLLKSVDPAIDEEQAAVFADYSAQDLRSLLKLLERIDTQE